MKKHNFKPSTLFLAVNALLLVTTVHAEDSNQNSAEVLKLPTSVVVANQNSYISEDLSGATGLELTAKKTPQSTTTITKKAMDDQQLSDVASVVKATNGVTMQKFGSGRSKYFARGFEIENINVDGMPVSYDSPWGEGSDIGSVAIYEGAEIVKGANGLMNSSGNASASINFKRKHADVSDFSGEASVTYDKFGTYGTVVDMGSKINSSGSVRGRAIIDYADGSTYIDREEKSRRTAYGVIDADITKDTLLSIGAMHSQKLQKGTMFGALPIFQADLKTMNFERIDWDANQSTGVDWGKRDGVTNEIFTSVQHDLNDDWNISANINHAQTKGDMKLFSVNGYVNKDNGMPLTQTPEPPYFGPSSPYIYKWKTDVKDTNISAEVSGNFDLIGQKHQVMVGADYNNYVSRSDVQNGIVSPVPVMGLIKQWDGSYKEPNWSPEYIFDDLNTSEYSVYGSTHLQLMDQVAIVAGSRVSYYQKEGMASPQRKVNIEHNAQLSPFIGSTIEINKNSAVFASYTSIFKPQNERSINGDYLAPIKGNNLEVGIKLNNDSETLQAQFSIFNIKQDDLAQQDTGKMVTGTNNMEQAYYGAEGATSNGIDLEVVGNPAKNLNLSIGYTYVDATDAADKAVNTTNPDHSVKLFTSYDASNLVPNLTVGTGINWNNGYYTTYIDPLTRTENKLEQDAVTLLSLMANYKVNNDLDLQINVDNTLNTKFVNSFAFNQVHYAEPLNVAGKLRYKW